MLAIRVPEEIESRLRRWPRRPDAPRPITPADLEDFYLASSRMLDIETGREKTIPLEEVMREYGMED